MASAFRPIWHEAACCCRPPPNTGKAKPPMCWPANSRAIRTLRPIRGVSGWIAPRSWVTTAPSRRSGPAGVLLEMGADARAVDKAGTTVLMIAAERPDAAMIDLLLKHGADPHAVD